ncbi:MAG: bifunctional diaminohydroxyphosphoribosylaminopyrimidine deaminase/5-amino-6-(5-phosphoribosylamino)uracil reductase RibD [Bacteroidetes bacterium]|nr:bifunctional diaminohydroxyphosphoribosylaminopyrimidine deaminase/5-amino-6-(5-phosphoribosylamino)uracil reductase RibD [Bacteroidota bacterium]
MSRCLELAVMGMGNVSPNPMVGAVLVHEGRIIGEGYHERYGQAHAEVNCLKSVKPEDRHLISDSTIYVTLEPCSHHGKTPPCADLIIDNQIKKVVTGSHDPHPLVSGRGIARMRAAGIDVVENVLRNECDFLNRRFITFHTRHRPYIILKWAQSAEGNMASTKDEQVWLSDEYSQKLSHKWRTEEDAILVGSRTAIIDDPQLTARLWEGHNPVRILIDRRLRVPETSRMFDEQAMTIIYNDIKEGLGGGNVYIRLRSDENVVSQILSDLHKRSLLSVIIEGGAYTLNEFVKAGLWDEARIIKTPVALPAGIPAPLIDGTIMTEEKLDTDTLIIKRNESL